jgi:hypothetical protein
MADWWTGDSRVFGYHYTNAPYLDPKSDSYQ